MLNYRKFDLLKLDLVEIDEIDDLEISTSHSLSTVISILWKNYF
jgi:hypothetical protein